MQKFEHLKAAFPSETDSLQVVIKGEDVTSPAVTAATAKLEQAMQKDKAHFPGSDGIEHDVNPDGTVDILSMAVSKDETKSDEALDALRGELVPATLGQVDGLQARRPATARWSGTSTTRWSSTCRSCSAS